MLSLHTILHPTDFSERSEFAFRLACALARDHGAHLVVTHVAHVPMAIYAEGAVPPKPEEFQDELLDKLQQIQPVEDDIQVSHRLEEGNPAMEILRMAELTQADLIVMGTHGRRGLARFLMGSVAEQVVRQATCPVLTVKMPLPSLVSALRESDAKGGTYEH
jgi:nucleotide-binding universal stress UspA family protein